MPTSLVLALALVLPLPLIAAVPRPFAPVKDNVALKAAAL
ncbi:MAG: hypothetical protein JWO82_4311, partial [Akkermansiaceae bacterium]|nr:hypothetical protein [Akkermansiaceae bacterium]